MREFGNAWILKRCSGVSGKLQRVRDFCCKTCVSGGPMQLEILEEISIGPERDQKLACVDKFCYLGDMIVEQEVELKKHLGQGCDVLGLNFVSWPQS